MNYIVQINFFEEIQNGDHDRIIKIVEKELKYNRKKTWKKLEKKLEKELEKIEKEFKKSSNRKGKKQFLKPR